MSEKEIISIADNADMIINGFLLLQTKMDSFVCLILIILMKLVYLIKMAK